MDFTEAESNMNDFTSEYTFTPPDHPGFCSGWYPDYEEEEEEEEEEEL